MSQNKKKGFIIAAHIVLWLMFLSIPTFFDPRRSTIGWWDLQDDIMELPRMQNALLMIGVFYLNYLFAIPKLYLLRKYVLYSLTVAGCFVIFFLINYHSGGGYHVPPMMEKGWRPPPGPNFPPKPGDIPLGNSFHLFMFLLTYTFSFALVLYEQWQKTKEQMLNTEISFLKAQINPHFLFNTLNSIYSLALTKSDNTADAVVKLSNMMRYSVSDNNQDFVSLSKEIAYISNYIDLQRLRLTDNIKVSYEVYGDADGKQIAPFLFIPFVENVFKHGVNSEEDCEIVIKIEVEEKYLVLKVVNNKVKQRPDRDTGTGLGINTTRKRLNLIYPGKHKLHINDNISTFIVSLQINLQ